MSITAQTALAPSRRVKRIFRPGTAVAYALLTIGAAGMLFPFLWMIATSLKGKQQLFSLNLIPNPPVFINYAEVFDKTPFTAWTVNSLIVAVITTLSVCFFDAIAGYILAKFEFAGKKLIFLAILSTLMVPTEMLIIPWYMLSVSLEWVDTYWGVLFPSVISAFGIFLMKQFMESLPGELLDAARIDGMNEWGIMLKIALPLVKPAIATLAILTFLGSWNAFIWPLIITQTPEQMTIPVGLSFFSSEQKDTSGWVLIMSGASISILPLIVLFFLFQRQIIRGIALTGLK